MLLVFEFGLRDLHTPKNVFINFKLIGPTDGRSFDTTERCAYCSFMGSKKNVLILIFRYESAMVVAEKSCGYVAANQKCFVDILNEWKI